MLSIGEYIKQIRESKNITVKELSKILIQKKFKASEKTIYSWENNNSQPTIDAFLTICNMYENEDILYDLGFREKKDITILTNKEKELLENYRNTEKKIQLSIFEILLSISKSSGTKTSYNTKPPAPIINIDTLTKETYRPLFDTPASAGTGIYLDEYISSEMTILPSGAPTNVDFGIRISGDSMTPSILDGSIVWAKKYQGESLIKRQIYIIEINDQAFCKMFDGVNFISINPKYNHLDLYEGDTVRVAGKVLFIENL